MRWFSMTVFAVLLVPGLCLADASAFTISSGTAMSNGSKLRFTYYARANGALPAAPSVVVGSTELNPTATYNYYGSYYHSCQWPQSSYSNGQLYWTGSGCHVECYLNGSWTHYTYLPTTHQILP